ncbi:hypothetical protein BN988_02220 [Oceanobacillus picturae]|uniref:Lipoprotein n=1 Tax=Oceanobacillus picturae TaxID=171693 RepID=W9ALD6_9BACI|nr:hypothetical protein [Oceanobacillus picturae]CDO03702.1 hypothetical protein BN988_02220 [Oceanobacillus picturae]
MKKTLPRGILKHHILFSLSALGIGCFFASLGNLLTLTTINVLGISLMIIAGITITADMWKKNKERSILTPLLIAVAIFFLI